MWYFWFSRKSKSKKKYYSLLAEKRNRIFQEPKKFTRNVIWFFMKFYRQNLYQVVKGVYMVYICRRGKLRDLAKFSSLREITFKIKCTNSFPWSFKKFWAFKFLLAFFSFHEGFVLSIFVSLVSNENIAIISINNVSFKLCSCMTLCTRKKRVQH